MKNFSRFKKIIISALSIVVLSSVALVSSGCGIVRGKTAYELAVDHGFVGTEEEWLDSLRGRAGRDGKDGENFNTGYTAYTLYEEAVSHGAFSGTFEEFIAKYFATGSASDLIASVNERMLSACSVTASYTYYGEDKYSAGSGVFYSVDKEKGDALIVTNFHVVFAETPKKLCDKITVFLYGDEYTESAIPCTFVGGTATYDIALLSVKGSQAIMDSDIIPVTFANSETLTLGEQVFAVGNSAGRGLSATTGTLSVDSEYITMNNVYGDETSFRVIRYDAAVSPGNSGGGLYNGKGELIGIVNAKTISTDVESLNYAIPSNIVRSVLNQLLKNVGTSNTEFSRPYVGITVGIDSSSAIYHAADKRTEIIEKIYIKSINEDSICSGKLQERDELTAFKVGDVTYKITRMHFLGDFIMGMQAGEELTIYGLRDGVEFSVNVTVTQESFKKVS